MTPQSRRWASALTGVLAVLTIGAGVLLGLSLVGVARGLGYDDELGVSIAAVLAVLVALPFVVGGLALVVASGGLLRSLSRA